MLDLGMDVDRPSWSLEGLYVETTYLETFPVEGRVELSRVAYGGSVHHTIVLTTPITVYGAVRDRVIVDHKTVTRVKSNTEVYSPFDTINS
jgi:hypothetical protein